MGNINEQYEKLTNLFQEVESNLSNSTLALDTFDRQSIIPRPSEIASDAMQLRVAFEGTSSKSIRISGKLEFEKLYTLQYSDWGKKEIKIDVRKQMAMENPRIKISIWEEGTQKQLDAIKMQLSSLADHIPHKKKFKVDLDGEFSVQLWWIG